jgi:hypothetical protein
MPAPFAASFFPLSLSAFSFAAESKEKQQNQHQQRLAEDAHSIVEPVAPSAACSEAASPCLSAPSASSPPLQLLCVPGDCTSIHQLNDDLTGLVVWPIAASLCRCLHRHPLLVSGRSVLELGSGTGLVGLVVASLGAQCVLTDSSAPSLVLCKHNAQLNRLEHRLRVARLSWGDDETELALAAASAASPACFDVIIGSDCAYKLSALDALFESVDLLLSRSSSLSPAFSSPCPPLFLLSFQPRYEDTTRRLLTVAAHYLFRCYLVMDEAQVKEAGKEEGLQEFHGAAVRLLERDEELLRCTRGCILMFVRRLPV